jgi:voltage-gated potassium channel
MPVVDSALPTVVPPASIRGLVHRHLEAANGRVTAVNAALMVLIVANAAALVAESVAATAAYAPAFRAFEAFSVAIFSIEYVLRVWSSAEVPRFADGVRGRLRYMGTPMAVIDLLAVLPFFLPARALDLRFLRVLRLLRVLRIAKLARYSTALDVLGAVLRDKRHELAMLLAVLLLLILCSGGLMYYAERDAQPLAFSSIPAAAWWSVVTLTTIGYGDVVPITAVGRLIGGIVAISGIALFALPAGMLGAAFTDAVARRRQADGLCAHCRQPLPTPRDATPPPTS